ncbi:transposase domain containing protein [Trichonephila clavipes]|nr:transposase domain containing protein [Trichonephila clavipes]
MGRQLRVQRPPIRNISDLCDRCLNIWYNRSPAIYQGLLASMSRRVKAVLYAKVRSNSCDVQLTIPNYPRYARLETKWGSDWPRKGSNRAETDL